METKNSISYRLGNAVAIAGFVLFAAVAPHSIAAAAISLTLALLGWILRTLGTAQTGFRRSLLDLPVWSFFLWTALSSFFSEEPSLSIPKLQAAALFLVFYLTHSMLTRRTAVPLVALMILSGVAGSLVSVMDLLRGRGVVVESISANSPLYSLVQPGDAIWLVGGSRVYSVAEIDEQFKKAELGKPVRVGLITRGEHHELNTALLTKEMQTRPSPSGVIGAKRSHRFRASGFTKHYGTFAEILQILTQLALGLAFANFQNHGANLRFKMAAMAALILAIGLGLTAMRTALVALAIGATVIALRSFQGRARLVIGGAIALILLFGAVVVWQTRAQGALRLQDDSAALRTEVARVGIERLPKHPIFGHGMDAVKRHWQEWGFPGTTQIHLHSTPLQIAFDRGVPALILWVWLIASAWVMLARAEKRTRDSGDSNAHGVLLGATGALAGFVASSMVNYNWGDSEVMLVFWWLVGIVLVIDRQE